MDMDRKAPPGGEARQAFLLELSDALRTSADPAEVQVIAARLLGEHLAVNRVFYSEVDGNEYVVPIGHFERGVPVLPPGRYSSQDFGAWMIAHFAGGETIVIEDVETDPRLADTERRTYTRVHIRAVVAVPLARTGKLVGIFAVHSASPRVWASADVALIEDTAQRTWLAIERARAEAKLHEAEERYLAVFNATEQAFCTIEMKFDERDQPLDYRFLEVSPSFEQQTGIQNAIGRWMRDIAPDHDEHWFQIYGRVAVTGEPVRFENYSTPLGRWWDVYAFRIQDRRLRRVGILFTEITRRKEAEQALRALLAERETLLKEVHHRVKNNLEVIDSLLSLQADAIPDPRVRAALAETSNRVHAIAEIHHLLYGSTDLTNVDIRTYAEELAASLAGITASGASRVRVVVEGDPLRLDLRRAVPVGLILNELISNALKHAFPGGREGTVRIGLRRDGQAVEIRVSDDGVGAAEVRRTGSLGLELVRVLADQLRGSLRFESGQGTSASVRFGAQPAEAG